MARSKTESSKVKLPTAESAGTDDSCKPPSVFDLRTIKELVALMSRHDVSEIDLRDGHLRIRLRRGQLQPMEAAPQPVVSVAKTTSPAPPAEEANVPGAKPAKELMTIKSPTPGTFYAASTPDAEPFVKVGSKVTPTTVVCIIEAMKIFNEITADCSGVVTEVLAENQQPVEYGQVLFKVDPAGS